MSACDICLEILDEENSRFARALASDALRSAIIAESSHFVALPSLGPLVFGHSLIVSREHERSLVVYAGENQLWSEISELVGRLHSLLKQVCNQSALLIFEHGSIRDQSTSCSTTHAHLHLLPLSSKTIFKALDMIPAHESHRTWDDLLNTCQIMEKFIWLGSISAACNLTLFEPIPARDLPSQFMRKVVAQVLGAGTWDWRQNLNTPLILKLINGVRSVPIR